MRWLLQNSLVCFGRSSTLSIGHKTFKVANIVLPPVRFVIKLRAWCTYIIKGINGVQTAKVRLLYAHPLPLIVCSLHWLYFPLRWWHLLLLSPLLLGWELWMTRFLQRMQEHSHRPRRCETEFSPRPQGSGRSAIFQNRILPTLGSGAHARV